MVSRNRNLPCGEFILIRYIKFILVFIADAWRTVVTSDSTQSGGLLSNQIARDERTHSHEVFEPHEPNLCVGRTVFLLFRSNRTKSDRSSHGRFDFLVHQNVHFAYKCTFIPSNIKNKNKT